MPSGSSAAFFSNSAAAVSAAAASSAIFCRFSTRRFVGGLLLLQAGSASGGFHVRFAVRGRRSVGGLFELDVSQRWEQVVAGECRPGNDQPLGGDDAGLRATVIADDQGVEEVAERLHVVVEPALGAQSGRSGLAAALRVLVVVLVGVVEVAAPRRLIAAGDVAVQTTSADDGVQGGRRTVRIAGLSRREACIVGADRPDLRPGLRHHFPHMVSGDDAVAIEEPGVLSVAGRGLEIAQDVDDGGRPRGARNVLGAGALGSGTVGASQWSPPHWHSQATPIARQNRASLPRACFVRGSSRHTHEANCAIRRVMAMAFSAVIDELIVAMPSSPRSNQYPRASRARARRARTAAGSTRNTIRSIMSRMRGVDHDPPRRSVAAMSASTNDCRSGSRTRSVVDDRPDLVGRDQSVPQAVAHPRQPVPQCDRGVQQAFRGGLRDRVHDRDPGRAPRQHIQPALVVRLVRRHELRVQLRGPLESHPLEIRLTRRRVLHVQ